MCLTECGLTGIQLILRALLGRKDCEIDVSWIFPKDSRYPELLGFSAAGALNTVHLWSPRRAPAPEEDDEEAEVLQGVEAPAMHPVVEILLRKSLEYHRNKLPDEVRTALDEPDLWSEQDLMDLLHEEGMKKTVHHDLIPLMERFPHSVEVAMRQQT